MWSRWWLFRKILSLTMTMRSDDDGTAVFIGTFAAVIGDPHNKKLNKNLNLEVLSTFEWPRGL